MSAPSSEDARDVPPADYADEIGDRLRAAQSATALVADPSVQGARVAA